MIKPLVIVILSFLLVTACNSPSIQRHTVLTQQIAASKCRVAEHELGKTCIPVKPRRIIVLNPSLILDPVVALGFKSSIIGINCYESWTSEECITPGFIPHELKGIDIVSIGYQPSLERILALKPDLILMLTDDFRQIYQQLSAIAPTVSITYNDGQLSFKDNFREIARLLDREKIAENLLIQYQKRVVEIRKQFSTQLKNKEISVLIYNGGQFTTSASQAIYFQIFKDIGVKIKPIFLTQASYTPFSIETIDDYDADILFIANFDRRPVSFFLEHPLISSLKAAKNGRIHIIDGREVWDVFGPIGVNRLLDRLSKYLLEDV
ncbi:iron-siderophore ABC transporter substrate-binding protein [Phormidesmis sp. 146-35]